MWLENLRNEQQNLSNYCCYYYYEDSVNNVSSLLPSDVIRDCRKSCMVTYQVDCYWFYTRRSQTLSNDVVATSPSYRLCYWTICYGRMATNRYDPNVSRKIFTLRSTDIPFP